MKALNKILDMAEREFEAMSQKGEFRSREDIELAYKLVDIVKDITTIDAMESEGYSNAYPHDGYYRNDGYSRADEYSRARKRDSMGRYSHTGDMLSELHRMKTEASGEDRAAIERCIASLEK